MAPIAQLNLLDLALGGQATAVYQQHLLHGADSWMFFILVPMYILTQALLRRFVAGFDIYTAYKPHWKRLMITYNLALSGFSLACAFKMTMIVLYERPNNGFALDNFSHPTYSAIVYVFYLSKYAEFLDTYFLLLQRKEVSTELLPLLDCSIIPLLHCFCCTCKLYLPCIYIDKEYR